MYTDETLILSKNTVLYLSSDGFADQNNEQRESFGSNNFLKLLDQVHQLPFETKIINILNTLKRHQKKALQRDDISVIGLKL